jgi:carbon monoxide dehydrogenase subunit G
MILEGQFTIPAAQERVWEAVWDVPTLASWVPGCTAAEQVDDTTYRAHMEQQVGFLKASFDLLLHVAETEAPRLIRLRGEGEDRKLRSNIQADITVELSSVPEGTLLHYRQDVSVLGRLGALGFPLIQRKAKDIEAEFARRARAGLAGG